MEASEIILIVALVVIGLGISFYLDWDFWTDKKKTK
ncbi:MAG: hypothetical protein KatS3mg002_0979 [Candidatus Woesearchaeota archaeon]|nr:MAG: hypothetical protein KatS3mg002_0979 [Candidatus Woesearchaeota archaeon]